MIRYEFNKEKLEEAVKNSKSVRGTARYLGIPYSSWIGHLIKKHKINIDHFTFGKIYDSYIGKKINSITIINVFKKHRKWFCICSCDCGNIKFEKRIDSVISNRVLSCGCLSKERPSVLGNKNGFFNGCGELTGSKIRDIKAGAKRRNIEFNVTKEYLWDIFIQQNKRCALTGVLLKFGRIYYPHETTASLDRIDSSKGYIIGNVQWVYKSINMMKMSMSQEDFINICKLVANNNP